MFKNLFSPKQEPIFTKEEAVYAQTCNDLIQEAVGSLLVLSDKGFINKNIPRQVEILAKMLETEAQANFNVVKTYFEQNPNINQQEKL